MVTRKERSKRREIRAILYRLRRRWGVPASIYDVDPGTPDLDTGLTLDSKIKIRIPEFITWLVTEQEKFEHTMAFAAANRNFTYGAVFEAGDRFGIIDAKYLPKGFKLKESDYLVFNSQRYDLKRWDVLDGDSGILMHLRHIEGSLPGQIIEIRVEHVLVVEQDIQVEL